ncbi:GDP-L-fucose synthase family protein [Candidatus Latescibacterota bacterium]
MKEESRIYIAGHLGMVGSAIFRKLKKKGYRNLICRTKEHLNLMRQKQVEEFFNKHQPEYVFLSAARVGGIQANIDHPAEFLYENLAIQNNVIHQSYLHGVKKLCFLGSSCIYPRACPQPMKEEYLLTGPLEPTNEGYSLAKIAGLKMVEFYRKQYGLPWISVIPCNLYGTNDSFDPLDSHVLSALVKNFVDAVDDKKKSITIWGSGKARREFMHTDDAAEAILFLMEQYDSDRIINVGWGEDVSIKRLAVLIAEKAGFQGNLIWDKSRPDGMPRKCMDSSKMKTLGYFPVITLEEGIEKTIAEYRELKKLFKDNL